MHSLYDVIIKVTDFTTGEPVSNATVSVQYDYDGYGWFFFANTPDDVSSVTDSDGSLVLKMADYRYRIILRVNSIPVGDVVKKTVIKGGSLLAPPKEPQYKVEIKPNG